MNYLKFLTLVVIVGGLIGCDLLDSQEPQQSLPADEVLSSPDGLENLQTGLYDGLQNASISGGNFNVLTEIMTDNVLWTGSFTNYARQAAREMNPSDGQIGAWWNISYREINTANTLLEKVDEVEDEPGFGDAERNLIRGDAYFARGMMYFELVRVFAKPAGFEGDNAHAGVPIRTDAVLDPEDFEELPRNTVQEVYDQAEADLLAARDYLPEPGGALEGRASTYAATTYLMRLELARGDYDAAADYAEEIISSGMYELTDGVEGPFRNEFSSESIFEIAHTPQDNPGVNAGQNAFYASTAEGGRGDIEWTDDYYEALSSTVTDDQQAAIDAAGLNVEETRFNLIQDLETSTTKFPDGIDNADNVLNSRYADILLASAEALVESAPDYAAVPEEAFDRLNEVRTRAIIVTDDTGAPFPEMIEFDRTDFTSQEEMVEAILLERRVELAFEGDRFYTLSRKGLDIRGLAPDDNRITFPIPQDELDSNANIEQNDGY